MKKLLATLLAAVLCLSLAACGGETQSEQQEAVSSSDVQTAAAIINISINPEFGIHVGNDGNVIAVECLNADAKAVNDKVSVIGKPCKDAIVLILQETVNQGFLKNGGEIKISVTVDDDISNQLDTWNNTVMDSVTQVLANNKLNADISFSSDSVNIGSEESAAPPLPSGMVLSSTDANGNMIVETDVGYIIIDKNGKKIEEVYTAAEGAVITLTFDENEKLIQAVHAMNDGTAITESYDKNGAKVREVLNRNDGVITTRDYDGNGNITFQRNDFVNGSWTEETFDNGVLMKEVKGIPDGASTQCIETEYYANGNIKSSLDYYPGRNSPYFEVRYYESGVKSYEYSVVGDSQYTEITYNEKGNRLTEKFREADGTRWELTYNQDGSRYGYTYYPDGSVWYNEWDAHQNQDLSAQKKIK